MLHNIRIILINTFHPGNIGSAARAMKTMGLSDLWLVTPQSFPAPEANSMAAGALDVLRSAKVVNSLDEAIANCSMVVGTSARNRTHTFSRPMLEADECAQKMIAESEQKPVALVFGQETMGLTNAELEKCHFHTIIDANPEYPVLNVASAIQILCYELRKAEQRLEPQHDNEAEEYPLQRELEMFYQHLEETLTDVNFIVKQHPGLVMSRLRRFFNRARPESKELNMLRGILGSVQGVAKNNRPTNED
ncbi:tRNA (cytosine(32)/uridine(32)-2'-O)-methyltransferase TrmJ [Endozoicomonas sp. (ex Bugula neritina AB1)]|nr:tRNA (cytosine(32)/uridine(32)-2'-O)-methyltransferase TrmJ [Endozoicomonas sp. (ex Bugula neritina AB1)]